MTITGGSKRALITGGQRGIGLGIATSLAKAGFDIAIASLPDVDDDQVREALDILESHGVKAAYFQKDLGNITDISGFMDKIIAEFGTIQCYVANAGIPAKVRGDMLDMAPDNYDLVMDVNLKGNFFLAQEVARRMLQEESSSYQSMIFISSVSASMVSKERAEYCMSKAGYSMMTSLFADRMAEKGVGVFEVRPGIIATDMTAGVADKYTALIEGGLVPAKRWGNPSDVGDVVVPMATGNMAFATGSVIAADGGLSIPRL